MIAIITVRFHSKRLPGKALVEINGIPSLQRTVDSLRKSRKLDGVIVATSDTSPQIISYCKANEIDVFSYENEEDCLTRLYKCTVSKNLSTAVRIWGDCPLLNISLIDSVAEQFQGGILFTQGFPKGWDFYVFDCKEFQNIYERMSPIEKYYWNNIDEINCWHGHRITKLISPVDHLGANFSLDTSGDLERLDRICKSIE
jgi:spore coat polysaccharide biosynthesis protein SpsF (cytidylyltransferase family)